MCALLLVIYGPAFRRKRFVSGERICSGRFRLKAELRSVSGSETTWPDITANRLRLLGVVRRGVEKSKSYFSIREKRYNIFAARRENLSGVASLPKNSRAAQGAGVMTKHLSSARMLSQITPRNRRHHYAPRRIVLCLKNDPQPFIPDMRLKPGANNLSGSRVGRPSSKWRSPHVP
jgi:hypothetical protein